MICLRQVELFWPVFFRTGEKSYGNNTGYGRITLQNRCFFYINYFWFNCLPMRKAVGSG
jgi:hypothetical protein